MTKMFDDLKQGLEDVLEHARNKPILRSKEVELPFSLDLQNVLAALEQMKNPQGVETKKRFGIVAENVYGISMKELRDLAKKIGKQEEIAIKLFSSGIYEAKLLVPLIFPPKNVTRELMEEWIKAFDNWEICDAFCMSFFGASPFVLERAFQWIHAEGEFQKRAGFVSMIGYMLKHKKATNEELRPFFPLMIEHSKDERKYVMKAINWLLRHMGKRNRELHLEAIEVAHLMLKLDSKPARWIAKDALRELLSDQVSTRYLSL